MSYYWLCPKPAAPSGGVQFINRLSALMFKMGFESYVVKENPFEVWWDEQMPVVPELDYVPMDKPGTVIIPEVLWNDQKNNFPGHSTICFMQNWQWMDKRLDWSGVDTITCSRYLSNYAKREFHMNVLGIIRPYLEETPFVFNDHKLAENSVMLMERRNGLASKLYEKFSALGFATGYIAQDMSRTDLAGLLNKYQFYVHPVTPEGFPLICLEAMRSGALVVGTSGGGGNEFMFDGENCIVTQDPIHGFISEDEFVQQMVDGVCKLQDNPDKRKDMAKKAYDWSLRYTEQATMDDLKKAFSL
jgi:hypothetical protein